MAPPSDLRTDDACAEECPTNLTPRLSEGCQKHFTSLFDRTNVISAGSSAIVERLSCGHVRKQPYPEDRPSEKQRSLQDIQREYDVYCRIINEPHFMKMIEFSEQEGIILQGALNDTLRQYLISHGTNIPLSKRLEWAQDIAVALHLLHESKVIHADVKSENVLLDKGYKAYLINFSGSWIDGNPGSAWESVRFFLPRAKDSDSRVLTDLFAFGSTLYEIMTGTEPYNDFDDEAVEKLFQQGQFPSLDGVACGHIIKKCWEGGFRSVNDVVVALEDEPLQ